MPLLAVSKRNPPWAEAAPWRESLFGTFSYPICQSTKLVSLHFSLHASLLGLLSITQHIPIWLENLNQGPLSCIRGVLLGQQKSFRNSNWVPLDWVCQLYLPTTPTIPLYFPLGRLSYLCDPTGSCRHLTFADIWLSYLWHKFCVSLA